MSGDDTRDLSGVNHQLLKAVEECLELEGWRDPRMITAEVLVLVAQRGFEDGDGISRVLILTPTESANYSMLGMMQTARIQVEEDIRVGMQDADG